MNCRWLGGLAILAIAVSGCQSEFQVSPSPVLDPTHHNGSDAATLAFNVSETTESIEGALEVLELTGPLAAEWQVADGASQTEVPAGHYRLVGFVRNCNGHCGWLGPPKNHCIAEFDAVAGETVEFDLRFFSSARCQIEMDNFPG